MNSMALVQQLEAASGVPDIFEACRELALGLSFPHFVYAVRVPISITQPYHFSISGYPAEWRSCYEDNGYLSIDPVINHVLSSLKPVLWDEIPRDTPAVDEFFTQSKRFGLAHGLTIPIYGRGGEVSLFSVAREAPLPTTSNERLQLVSLVQWFATHVHEAVRAVVLTREGRPIVRGNLTAREKDCLVWAADGKTSWEISVILEISERTVNFHLQNASEKLGVHGSRNAVAKAIALGEIETPAYSLPTQGRMPTIHWHTQTSLVSH